MIDTSFVTAGLDALAAGLVRLIALLHPFGPDSRLHWTGLSAFLILGMAVYLGERRRSQAGTSALATTALHAVTNCRCWKLSICRAMV
jgi:hypothetical protein